MNPIQKNIGNYLISLNQKTIPFQKTQVMYQKMNGMITFNI
jgi:hypothetical protein